LLRRRRRRRTSGNERNGRRRCEQRRHERIGNDRTDGDGRGRRYRIVDNELDVERRRLDPDGNRRRNDVRRRCRTFRRCRWFGRTGF
jgi:hypothetical protein